MSIKVVELFAYWMSLGGRISLATSLGWFVYSAEFDYRSINVDARLIGQKTEKCPFRYGRTGRTSRPSRTCYRPEAEYYIAGTRYSSILPETRDFYYPNSTRFQLKVDPRSPTKARNVESLWSGPIFFAIYGSVFWIVGRLLRKHAFRKQRLINDLQNSPHRVRGRVTYVGPNTSIKVDLGHPWIVKAEWTHPSTGQTHTATTLEELTKVIQSNGQLEADGTVEVRFDPLNPKRAAIFLRSASVAPEDVDTDRLARAT